MKKFVIPFLLTAVMVLGSGLVSTSVAQSQSADDTNKTITLTEYSDYECPACGYFYPIVKKLKAKYGEQIKLNLKFYPLNSHQFSALAARAAQAAKNQGKFHEMHNKLFENQDYWVRSSNPQSIFVNYAKDLDLDVNQFKKDLNSAETQKTVMEQKQEGREAGVNATPTFFIEGKMIDPLPQNFEQFDSIIQKYLSDQSNG